MKQLYKRLPTFAPDYSGAHNVGYDMGGILVVHDPGACQGQAYIVDDPRSAAGKPPSFSVAIREVDAVVGSDARVLDKVVNAVRTTNSKLVVLISSPSSMLIGTDIAALGRLIEKKSGVPVLAVQTDGLHFYDEGQAKAYMAMVRKFLPQTAGKKQSLVNVLGATPLDMWDMGSLQDLEAILRGCGFKNINVWGYGSPDDVAQSVNAQVNVVVSVSALDAAREMKRRYGIPYVKAHLFGVNQQEQFCREICAAAGLPVPSAAPVSANMYALPGVKKALIIGEQLQSCALRDCLKSGYGIEHADVVSFFRMDKELLEGADAHLAEEEDLQNFVDTNGPYDIIFGDNILQRALTSVPALYVSIPHPAVSSLFSCFSASNVVGYKGNEYLESVWQQIRELMTPQQCEEYQIEQADDKLFM